jgi:hypothetical protein
MDSALQHRSHPAFAQGADSSNVEIYNGCGMEGDAGSPGVQALNRLKNRYTAPQQIDPAIPRRHACSRQGQRTVEGWEIHPITSIEVTVPLPEDRHALLLASSISPPQHRFASHDHRGRGRLPIVPANAGHVVRRLSLSPELACRHSFNFLSFHELSGLAESKELATRALIGGAI